MGAAALLKPGSQAAAPQTSVDHMGAAVQHAVDLYDAAAQLESQGFGDAVARRDGFRDVFEMAGGLMGNTRSRRAKRPATGVRSMLVAALGRMLVLFSGVVISLAVLPPDAAPGEVFVAGAVGWICGQAASAGIWHGLGTARHLGAGIALTASPILLAMAAVMVLATASWAPLLWALWSISASVLVIMRPGIRVVLFAVLGAWTAWALGQVWHPMGMVFAIAVILVACAVAVRVILAEGGVFARPSWPMLAAQFMGAVQAAGQIVVLGMVLLMIGPTVFVAVAIGGLVAGALSDPILEAVHAGVRHIASFPLTLRTGKLLTALLGICGTAGVMAAAVLTSIVVRDLFAPEEELLPVVLATCLVAGVTAGTGLLLRAGTALGAMLLALGEAAFGAVGEGLLYFNIHPDMVIVLWVLAISSVLATSWLAARNMSRPAAW